MKKILTPLILAAVALSAQAKGPQAAVDEQMAASFDKTPRVLIIDTLHNAISAQGEPLICPPTVTMSWQDANRCEIRGKNAWQLAETALPGWVLKRYEYRFTGSGGYQILILYFGKK